MSLGLYIRLSVMMLLQYWIWGAWGSYLPVYLTELGFSGAQKGQIMGMLYLASLITPFIGGQIADRYISVERFLAIAHFVGGFLLLWMAEYITFFHMLIIMFCYSLLYAPTIPLTNALSFKNLTDVDRDFGKIRVWGTIGWILAGWVLSGWLYFSDDGANCLRLAGIASLLLGVFSFWLPHTPPSREGNPLAFLEALKMLKRPSFLIFMIISFVVATELMFYYILTGPFLEDLGTNSRNIPWVMTIAQIAELLTLVALMPYLLPRVGIKTAMAIGIITWPIRYIIFAIGTPYWLVVASLALHGICYVFFFVVGQIYVDRVAPPDIRNSAQGLLALVTFGLGLYLGSSFAGWIESLFTHVAEDGTTIVNWSWVFMVPVVLTILCAILFLIFFKDPQEQLEKEA